MRGKPARRRGAAARRDDGRGARVARRPAGALPSTPDCGSLRGGAPLCGGPAGALPSVVFAPRIFFFAPITIALRGAAASQIVVD